MRVRPHPRSRRTECRRGGPALTSLRGVDPAVTCDLPAPLSTRTGEPGVQDAWPFKMLACRHTSAYVVVSPMGEVARACAAVFHLGVSHS